MTVSRKLKWHILSFWATFETFFSLISYRASSCRASNRLKWQGLIKELRIFDFLVKFRFLFQTDGMFPHGTFPLKEGNWSRSLEFFKIFLYISSCFNTNWSKLILNSISYVRITKNGTPGCFQARKNDITFHVNSNFVLF